jgi:hypothetical protein
MRFLFVVMEIQDQSFSMSSMIVLEISGMDWERKERNEFGIRAPEKQ